MADNQILTNSVRVLKVITMIFNASIVTQY